MRWIVCVFLGISCLFGVEREIFSNGDIGAQIKRVEEQIAIHKRRALYAEREAERLLSIDYSDYRRYLTMKERNDREVERLTKELERLQSLQQKK